MIKLYRVIIAEEPRNGWECQTTGALRAKVCGIRVPVIFALWLCRP